MNILAVDTDKERLAEMDDCLRAAFPHDTVLCFTDPACALRYGWRNTAGMVFTSTFAHALTTGLHLASGLRLRSKDVKVYMLLSEREYSGFAVAEAQQAGVDGCFMHPISRQILQML